MSRHVRHAFSANCSSPLLPAQAGWPHGKGNLGIGNVVLHAHGGDFRLDRVALLRRRLALASDEDELLLVVGEKIVSHLRDVNQPVDGAQAHESAELDDFAHLAGNHFVNFRVVDNRVELDVKVRRPVAGDDAPLAANLGMMQADDDAEFLLHRPLVLLAQHLQCRVVHLLAEQVRRNAHALNESRKFVHSFPSFSLFQAKLAKIKSKSNYAGKRFITPLLKRIRHLPPAFRSSQLDSSLLLELFLGVELLLAASHFVHYPVRLTNVFFVLEFFKEFVLVVKLKQAKGDCVSLGLCQARVNGALDDALGDASQLNVHIHDNYYDINYYKSRSASHWRKARCYV